MTVQGFTRLCMLATALAVTVAVFGAFVRLTNAGLSCPDWPGCYGQSLVPGAQGDVSRADDGYAQRPLDVHRARTEMIHRYLAGLLGLFILSIAVTAWRRRIRPGQQLAIPFVLVLLVVFQAFLGIWTITPSLKPLVVTAHLLGGFTITALLWWVALRHGGLFTGYSRPLLGSASPSLAPWIILGLLVLYTQIFLGGWVSTSYAALACPDFPLCQGELLPTTDFNNAEQLRHGVEIDYDGGILSTDARVTIHLLHRLGALVAFVYLGALALMLLRGDHDLRLRVSGAVLALVLLFQVGLGIANVLLGLPLAVAVAHNAGAILLLLTLVSVYHMARPARTAV